MAKHYVICLYCNEKFDREAEPAVKVNGRRYAHQKCVEEHEKSLSEEEQDLHKLEKYIMELFSDDTINPRIRRQINDFKTKNKYTYSGMLKTLIYWFEIKKGDIEKTNHGIGIIPWIYDEACQYYYSLYLAKIANESKEKADYERKTRTVEIFSPEANNLKLKLFNFNDGEE